MARTTRLKSAERITWIDVAKGIGIVTVVVYHVWNGLLRITPRTEAFGIVEWTACQAMMAMFFFLAGVFVLRSPKQGWPAFVIDKLQVLAWPYLLWATIQVVLQRASADASEAIAFSDLPRVLLLDPPGQFWFLYILLFAMLAMAALLRLGVHPVACLVLAIAWYATLPFYRMGDWGALYQLRHFLMFLAAGVVMRPVVLGLHERPMSLMWAIAAVAGAVAVIGIVTGTHDETFAQPAFAALGAAAVIGFAVALDRLDGGTFLRFAGRHSLAIFLVHVIAAAAVRTVLFKLNITAFLPHLIAGCLAGLFVPLLMASVAERYGIRFVFSAKPVRAARVTASIPHPQPTPVREPAPVAAATREAGTIVATLDRP